MLVFALASMRGRSVVAIAAAGRWGAPADPLMCSEIGRGL